MEVLDNLSNDEKLRRARAGELILASGLGKRLIALEVARAKERRRQLLLEIGETASLDRDLNENPGYMEAKANIDTVVEQYLAAIRAREATALFEQEPDGSFSFGTFGTVTIRYSDGEKQQHILLLGSHEAGSHPPLFYTDARYEQRFRVISYESPIGAALIGLRSEQVSAKPQNLKMPNGTDASIVAIEVLGQADLAPFERQADEAIAQLESA